MVVRRGRCRFEASNAPARINIFPRQIQIRRRSGRASCPPSNTKATAKTKPVNSRGNHLDGIIRIHDVTRSRCRHLELIGNQRLRHPPARILPRSLLSRWISCGIPASPCELPPTHCVAAQRSRKPSKSTSSHIGTSGAPQRRKFPKSLICFWFLYSNQSCCAAPF